MTQDEAFDKAKQLGLSPDQAARDVIQTPRGSLLCMMPIKVKIRQARYLEATRLQVTHLRCW